jgi:hypothetical protein
MGTTMAPRNRHPKNTATPFGAVLTPDQDLVAFADAARFQLAREAVGIALSTSP